MKKASALIYDESMVNAPNQNSQVAQIEPQQLIENSEKKALVQPPKMSYLERKRMKNNMKMALVTMQQEEEKAEVVEKKIEISLKQQQEAEKILKQDVYTQKEQMQKRLIQRKRSRAASQGLNNSFSFSLGLQSKSQLEVDCN